MSAEEDPEMMDASCPDAESLALYIENRMDPSIHHRVQRHLLRCPRCWELYVETLRTMIDR